jgi:hypothetical protein
MRSRVMSSARLLLAVLAPLSFTGCGPGKMAQEMMEAMSGRVMPAPNPDQPPVDLPGTPPPPPPDPDQVRPIPFDEALPPGDPPPPAAPPPRPLAPWDMAAQDALYERPAPMGPAPIPTRPAKAIYVTAGKGPIYAARPGPTVFAEKVPRELAVAGGPTSEFSNNIAPFPRGEVRWVAFDRTLNDSRMSQDSMAFDANFTDEEGNEWRIVQMRIAPLSPNIVTDPWYGGVAIDTTEHGQTMRGHPAQPLSYCASCSWGWADVWKNGKRVASSALLHVMLTNPVRDPASGWRYKCYDCPPEPPTQIHVEIMPDANLPTPGGFLHVMFENAEVVRGTPDEVAARAPALGPNLPSLMLLAVPHIRWSDTEITMQVGQPVRVSLRNMDPASNHAFMVRTPEGLLHVPLPQGSRWDTAIRFDQPGEYEFWCPVGNHRGRGMYGRFIVTESVPGGTVGPPGKSDREE